MIFASLLVLAAGSRISVSWEERWLPEAPLYPAQGDGSAWVDLVEANVQWDSAQGSASLELDAGVRWSGSDPALRQILPRLARVGWSGDRTRLDLGILRHAWSWADAQGPFDLLDPVDLGSDLLPRQRWGGPGVALSTRAAGLAWQTDLAWPWTASVLPEPSSRPGTPLAVRQENRWFPRTARTPRPDIVLRASWSGDGPELGILAGQAVDRVPDLAQRVDATGPWLEPSAIRSNLLGVQARDARGRVVLRAEELWRRPDAANAETWYQAVVGAELDGTGWLGGTTPMLIVEYHRSDLSESVLRPLTDHFLSTLRLSLNDASGTEFSATAIVDRRREELPAVQADASRRFGDHVKIRLGWRWIDADDASSGFATLRRDGQGTARVDWIF